MVSTTLEAKYAKFDNIVADDTLPAPPVAAVLVFEGPSNISGNLAL